MKILIVYATTEGQTRKTARFAADRLIETGHSVEILAAGEADGEGLDWFDGVILAGSVHAGRYQKELMDFARTNAEALNARPTLFLSVSLTASGEDERDWEGLRAGVDRFLEDTGWTPGHVEHVAGAFRFDEYDFFKSWAMRWIAREKGEEAPAHGQDKEYTDWPALGARLDSWVGGLSQSG